MASFHIPHEIFREIVTQLDREVQDDRWALRNLRLTNSMFNDVATPVLFKNHSLSFGSDPEDLLRRLSLLSEISPDRDRDGGSGPSYSSPATNPNPDRNNRAGSTRTVRKTHVADITRHITGLIFSPEVIVPRAFQNKTAWVGPNCQVGEFMNVTEDEHPLRRAMADAGLRFVTKALELVDLLPGGGGRIATLDVRVRYDGDNFEAVEEYFCKTLSLFFYYTCSSVATEDCGGGAREDVDGGGGRNTFGNSSLANAKTLRFTTEEFDAPNYFILPPSGFIVDAEKYFRNYPAQLHRSLVDTVHVAGGSFDMFPQVTELDFAYLIDEVNKSSSRWEHSSSDYSERSYMTRLVRRPEILRFAAKGCWVNVPDISKEFSFSNLTTIVLSEMVFMLKSFSDCFLKHVKGRLTRLELHSIEAFITAPAIVEPGFGEDYFGVLFSYCAEHLGALTAFKFSALRYHDMYFQTQSDTSWWRETDEVPLVVPGSGGRLRPMFSPFDADFKELAALRGIVKRRRMEKGMKEDGFLRFCESGTALTRTPIGSPKYLKLLNGGAD